VTRALFQRNELLEATLDLGSMAIALNDYATLGIRAMAIAPSGAGKTNAGLLLAEQLAGQGWISVLFDPEGEIEALELGELMASAEKLETHLRGRHHPILVCRVRDTQDFLTYGRVLLRVVDDERKPVFLMVDEGQIFSTSRRSKGLVGEASDLMNDFTERGRKRALDLFITAHRFSGTLHRSIFANRNLTFIGRQEDPTAWSALAPQFRESKIAFSDLAALAPGEFFCFSRRGVQKILMPMAAALKSVAREAVKVRPALPATYADWDTAMREIPDDRLIALDGDVVSLLASIAGVSQEQLLAGGRALRDEKRGGTR
jgi:DNA helicase HerA-like ATPase